MSQLVMVDGFELVDYEEVEEQYHYDVKRAHVRGGADLKALAMNRSEPYAPRKLRLEEGSSGGGGVSENTQPPVKFEKRQTLRTRPNSRQQQHREYLKKNEKSTVLLICNLDSRTIFSKMIDLCYSKSATWGLYLAGIKIPPHIGMQKFAYVPFKEGADEAIADFKAALEKLSSSMNHPLPVYHVHGVESDGLQLPFGRQPPTNVNVIIRDLPSTITKTDLHKALRAHALDPVDIRFLLRSGIFDGLASVQFASTKDAAIAHTTVNSVVLFGSHSMVRAEFERTPTNTQQLAPPFPKTADEGNHFTALTTYAQESLTVPMQFTTIESPPHIRSFIIHTCASLGLTCVANGETPTQLLTVSKPLPPTPAAAAPATTAVFESGSRTRFVTTPNSTCATRQPRGPTPGSRGFGSAARFDMTSVTSLDSAAAFNSTSIISTDSAIDLETPDRGRPATARTSTRVYASIGGSGSGSWHRRAAADDDHVIVSDHRSRLAHTTTAAAAAAGQRTVAVVQPPSHAQPPSHRDSPAWERRPNVSAMEKDALARGTPPTPRRKVGDSKRFFYTG